MKIKNQKLLTISMLIILTILIVNEISIKSHLVPTLCVEAFCTILMSLFVLKPLSEIFSKENSKKLFWTLFAIRACILIFFDLFITPAIAIVDFFAIFVGIFLVGPLSTAITKTSVNGRINQINTQPNSSISGIELKCAKCNSVLQITDKLCPSCGEPFDGNNVIVSKNDNATIQIPQKVVVLPTNFDKMYSLTEDKMLDEFINRELTKAGIDKTSKLMPSDILKRKRILNLIFSFLVFIFITLIFFHFPLYTYIIGIIILFIFFKMTRRYDLIKYLKKEIKARPGEKLSNIVMNVKNTFLIDNTKAKFVGSLLVGTVLPLIIFSTPKILYEKTDDGYAVRYYIFGLTNFKTATIPETHNNEKVVSLRGNTFSNMPFLESVVLPNTITEIRGQAFKNCKKLTNVNIPNKLEYLGGGAFYNASSIKKIELPDTLTFLGGEAFYRAKSLETVKLSKNLNEIRGDSFKYCYSLRSITIPDNVERIGGHAFYGNSSLSEVVFTENSKLTEIGSSAFRRCRHLYSITIPNGVYVNERAFKESPTSIKYFFDENSNYNNYSNNYSNSYSGNSKNISIPYLSDYMVFKSKNEVLNINEYSLKLDYSTGILNNNIYNEAYVSGTVYNPMYLVGKMVIKIHFYDSSYNELVSHQKEIELLGKGYSAISFHCGVSIEELAENKTFNDIYYYKIEILQLSIN